MTTHEPLKESVGNTNETEKSTSLSQKPNVTLSKKQPMKQDQLIFLFSASFPEPEIGLSEKLLDHFRNINISNQIKNIKSQIQTDPCILSIPHINSAFLTHFNQLQCQR